MKFLRSFGRFSHSSFYQSQRMHERFAQKRASVIHAKAGRGKKRSERVNTRVSLVNPRTRVHSYTRSKWRDNRAARTLPIAYVCIYDFTDNARPRSVDRQPKDIDVENDQRNLYSNLFSRKSDDENFSIATQRASNLIYRSKDRFLVEKATLARSIILDRRLSYRSIHELKRSVISSHRRSTARIFSQ